MNHSKNPTPSHSKNQEFGAAYAQWQISRESNYFRRFVKHLYIKNVLRFVSGPMVDVGCGAGQILEQLPTNSLGLEINSTLVKELSSRGLNVVQADAISGRLDISAVTSETYQGLILSHVLEHFDNAADLLRQLFTDAKKVGINDIIIIVPGEFGYSSDATHKTFIDFDYLLRNNLLDCQGYELTHRSYFPGNSSWIGKVFIYHEMMIIYKLKIES